MHLWVIMNYLRKRIVIVQLYLVEHIGVFCLRINVFYSTGDFLSFM